MLQEPFWYFQGLKQHELVDVQACYLMQGCHATWQQIGLASPLQVTDVALHVPHIRHSTNRAWGVRSLLNSEDGMERRVEVRYSALEDIGQEQRCAS